MPPGKKIKKEEIVEAALKLTRSLGPDSVNARAVAGLLHCSVQPIFSNFASMQELKQQVLLQAREIYLQYMREGAKEEQPYRGLGVAYIRFAEEEPQLFRMLFMQKTDVALDNYMDLDDASSGYAMKYGKMATGLSVEDMRRFHRNVYLFTHGIAAMAAGQTCHFTREEILEMLSDMFRGQMALFEKEKREKKE